MEKLPKKGVVLIQLGCPDSPKASHIRSFLKKFLQDPRVIDKKPALWNLILFLFILPFRPKHLVKAYGSIYKDGQFSLRRFSSRLRLKVEEEKNKTPETAHLEIREAYLIGEPSLKQASDDLVALGCESIHYQSLFPQFSGATTLSVLDGVEEVKTTLPSSIQTTFGEEFFDLPSYIESVCVKIEQSLQNHPVEKLVLSFHGFPIRRILDGDPYYDQCLKSASLIQERIKGIKKEDIIVCFQSKFGREDWLLPATAETVLDLPKKGIRKIAVVCPAFTVDNLETEWEIGTELKENFIAAGGEELIAIPCINDEDQWSKGLLHELLIPSPEQTPHLAPAIESITLPEQKLSSTPLSPKAKKSLTSVFLILFLDLVGFSVIFPLFPSMLSYYEKIEGQEGLYGWMMQLVVTMRDLLGGGSGADIVLFGGILGSIYSVLQFIFSPIIGTLSDRVGRKPVLLVCMIGIAISYGFWFFAGSFSLLVFARLLGGMASGNISTASAVVADVTDSTNRSKGMATVGIAFGLGFVIGPALGALLSEINLIQIWPGLSRYGVNPFSVPALFAFLLSLFNIYYIQQKFSETLKNKGTSKKSLWWKLNLIQLFKMDAYPGIRRNNMLYFFFLLAFSGMEFTLSFLAFERFGYTNMQQGMMFLFIGVSLSFIQGGYVRRAVQKVGEKKMAGRGLICLMPGLVLIGLSPNEFVLYLGLFLMTIGSAQVTPCLSGLASLYAPDEIQGQAMGVFRSLGSLSRALGPFMACFIYWQLGPEIFYIFVALFILLPLYLWRKLPEPQPFE